MLIWGACLVFVCFLVTTQLVLAEVTASFKNTVQCIIRFCYRRKLVKASEEIPFLLVVSIPYIRPVQRSNVQRVYSSRQKCRSGQTYSACTVPAKTAVVNRTARRRVQFPPKLPNANICLKFTKTSSFKSKITCKIFIDTLCWALDKARLTSFVASYFAHYASNSWRGVFAL